MFDEKAVPRFYSIQLRWRNTKYILGQSSMWKKENSQGKKSKKHDQKFSITKFTVQ